MSSSLSLYSSGTLGTAAPPASELDVEPAPSHKKLLKQLGGILKTRPSFSHGIMQLPPQSFNLFYRKAQDVRHIDLSNAADEELAHLSSVCVPATFGCNHQDVLDETYRKARKLDCSDFACHFDAERSGLVRAACHEILVGKDGSRRVKAELYKLNVYGPGSFFKPHQDTPRGENMFGSLVVVFPTAHEGGELVLRPRDAEDTTVLDFGARLSEAKAHSSSIAYAVFFSDVTHEVYEVKRGYRVTLTYNLYFDAPIEDHVSAVTTLPSSFQSDIPETLISQSLTDILSDPTFLPDGGLIGFGLRYQYPVRVNNTSGAAAAADDDYEEYYEDDYDSPSRVMKNILSVLKGTDSAVHHLLSEQGYKPFLMAIYDTDGKIIMCDRIVQYISPEYGESLSSVLPRDHHGVVIDMAEWAGDKELEADEPVTWVTEPMYQKTYKTEYAAFGNEAMVETAYADLALMVMVGKPGERTEARDVERH